MRPACLLGRGYTLCLRQGPEPVGMSTLPGRQTHLTPQNAQKHRAEEEEEERRRRRREGSGKCGDLPQGREGRE